MNPNPIRKLVEQTMSVLEDLYQERILIGKKIKNLSAGLAALQSLQRADPPSAVQVRGGTARLVLSYLQGNPGSSAKEVADNLSVSIPAPRGTKSRRKAITDALDYLRRRGKIVRARETDGAARYTLSGK